MSCSRATARSGEKKQARAVCLRIDANSCDLTGLPDASATAICSPATGQLRFDLDHFRSRPGQRIEDEHWHALRLWVLMWAAISFSDPSITPFPERSNFRQIPPGIEIIHRQCRSPA